jgi:hypothetical protein
MPGSSPLHILRPNQRDPGILHSLGKSDLDVKEFLAFFEEQKLQHPFLQDHLGLKNPYTGCVVKSQEDYSEYLREHSYYALRDRKARAEVDRRLRSSRRGLFIFLAVLLVAAVLIVPRIRSNAYQRGLDVAGAEYSRGYEAGKIDGYESGKTDGEKTGYESGVKAGEKTGYDSGYRDGLATYAYTAGTDPFAGNRSTSGSSGSATGTGTPRDDPIADAYIGNKNSKKFHKPTCSYLPDQKNQVTFDTREEAIAAGYDPCGHCKP